MNKDHLELSDTGGFSWPCERLPEAVRSGCRGAGRGERGRRPARSEALERNIARGINRAEDPPAKATPAAISDGGR
jgi:hypothetical protein